MTPNSDTTLSQKHVELIRKGYSEDFKAMDEAIIGLKSKNEYQPEDLVIEDSYRFEGMTNPADSQRIMAIKANDGIKGTLVMAHGAKHSQNTELIERIKEA